MSSDTTSPADQYACTEIVVEETPDAAIVANLGVSSYVLAGVADRPRNFYQWGSMGVTTPIGLGLAMRTDEQVTVLDGDGSMLMSLGALVPVARYDPSNLTIVLWDNGRYGTTGGQPTMSHVVNFVSFATDSGMYAVAASTAAEFRTAYADAVKHDGASMVVVETAACDPPERPPLDYAHIKRRFRAAIGGE